MRILNICKIIVIFSLTATLVSCGMGEKVKNIRKPVDLRTQPLDPDERARKNIQEGRGISLGSLGNQKTTYEFSTSNPMWRATLDILDFLPLSTVDYSGGIIISDWYTDETNKNQALKITVRFMSNVVQSNSLKITVHRKKCSVNQSCNVELFKSRIQEELIASILKEAAILEKQVKK